MTSSWKFKCFIKEYGQCHECQVLSNLWYKTKLSRQWPCWSLRRGFNGLDKDNCKMRREIFKIWDWVPLILEVWQYICYVTGSHCYLGTWRDELISCWINPLHQDDVILTPLLISMIIVLALNSKYDCTCSVWWVRTSGTKIDIPEVPLSSSQMVVININKESVHQLCLQNQSKWKTVSTEYISWKLSSQ